MLIIASGLSIQDPRERPAEHREQADALHRRFWADGAPRAAPSRPEPAPLPAEPSTGTHGLRTEPADGDFAALLRLWDYLRTAQRDLSGNAFRRLCRDEFLHFLRIREWQDLHAQLRDITRELRLERNRAAAPIDQVHRAVLSGLLSNVGLAEVVERAASSRGRRGRAPREYLGARGTRFAINPGSSVGRRVAAAGDGRRDRRDHAALGPDGGGDQRRAGRTGRRPPGQAQLLRAALVGAVGGRAWRTRR